MDIAFGREDLKGRVGLKMYELLVYRCASYYAALCVIAIDVVSLRIGRVCMYVYRDDREE